MTRTLPARPPGPRALPWCRELLRRDPTGTLLRLARDHPRLARLPLGTTRAYLLNHPDLVTALLVRHGRATRKGRMQDSIRIVLGDGLLTSEGPDHARQRRRIQPALHGDRLRAYYPLMAAAADTYARRWRDGDQVDLAQQMSALTLSVVGRALFGGDLTRESAVIAACVNELLSGYGRHLLPGGELLLALPTPGNRRIRRAVAQLDQLVWRLVSRRAAEADAPGAAAASAELPPADLLSVLVRHMPPERARDEAMTLLLAGHETTATALTWAWWLLDRRPDVARWWRAELDRTEPGAAPERLPRTRAVFAEAMRLYPPSWLLGRRLTEPVELDGWVLPAGTLCAASQWAMHRDPRFWTRPAVFEPQRWLAGEEFDEAAPGQPRGAYLPFGMGARACVGRELAWAEGTLLLAGLGRRWAPKVLPGVRVAPLPAVTLRPRYGLPAVVRARGAGR